MPYCQLSKQNVNENLNSIRKNKLRKEIQRNLKLIKNIWNLQYIIHFLIFYLTNQNKSAKWHCGRHTLWLKKYMNDVWSVVLKNKNF